MKPILGQLIQDCSAYREAVDEMLSIDSESAEEWRRCLLKILICGTKLQMDRLILVQKAQEVTRLRINSKTPIDLKHDVKREKETRRRVEQCLKAASVWNTFRGDNPLARLHNLRSVDDYHTSFRLHLPEIYEETFYLEKAAALFIAEPSQTILVLLFIALDHMGHNHFNFVQPALDWASDEDWW